MAIEVARFANVHKFIALAEPVLVKYEAENNLLLGTLSALAGGPAVLQEDAAYLGVGTEGAAIVGVAIWTPGNRAVLSVPDHAEFGEAAGRILRATGLPVPGVFGPRAASIGFAVAWSDDDGTARQGTVELIYSLSAVSFDPDVPGRLRRADQGDLDVLVRYWIDRYRERNGRTVSGDEALAIARSRLGGEGGITYLWQTDRPVSMVVASGPTPHGIRVNGVYTPPELRGRGFATACVSALSRLLLDEGRQFCFLFTDAADPTPQAIYRRIGYEQVGEGVRFDFARQRR